MEKRRMVVLINEKANVRTTGGDCVRDIWENEKRVIERYLTI